MANRYALRMDEPESWNIFDIFTGQPVELKQQVMVAMNLRDAEAMADCLNSRDVKRRAKADRKS
ncbi:MULTISPECIES: hypothetical protein [unclassified Mesorhizobium]|uniref:hypothetical protein n=1 Tax=unclassified Mesorhizobium TaxID=325217 RepID=UPI0003CE3F6C|nr:MULTISPECIES: hypothetical protein [unclassified Mesorhizobium]ESY15530.1 hypothetical protein X751_23630 [Mesorhizobium sp. LNJC395A00]WJI75603.1 hypothetical protein NLY37_02405 [Mesorhizobium sp. C395A]